MMLSDGKNRATVMLAPTHEQMGVMTEAIESHD